jgi:hypothetical protein
MATVAKDVRRRSARSSVGQARDRPASSTRPHATSCDASVERYASVAIGARDQSLKHREVKVFGSRVSKVTTELACEGLNRVYILLSPSETKTGLSGLFEVRLFGRNLRE